MITVNVGNSELGMNLRVLPGLGSSTGISRREKWPSGCVSVCDLRKESLLNRAIRRGSCVSSSASADGTTTLHGVGALCAILAGSRVGARAWSPVRAGTGTAHGRATALRSHVAKLEAVVALDGAGPVLLSTKEGPLPSQLILDTRIGNLLAGEVHNEGGVRLGGSELIDGLLTKPMDAAQSFNEAGCSHIILQEQLG